MPTTANKVRNLQSAFEKKPAANLPAEQAAPKAKKTVAEMRKSSRAPSREGKEFIGGWLSPQYKARLFLIQAKVKGNEGRTVSVQDLLAEGLNDLYRKYDVPTVEE